MTMVQESFSAILGMILERYLVVIEKSKISGILRSEYLSTFLFGAIITSKI